MIKKNIFIVSVNLLIAFVLLETLGVGYFFYKENELFYAREIEEISKSNIDPHIFTVKQSVFHPYIGYTLHPDREDVIDLKHLKHDEDSVMYKNNNHGFQYYTPFYNKDPDCCDYPITRKAKDDIIVAIFGGSVGLGLATTAMKTQVLQNELKRIKKFSDKNIRVLNFAMSGFKQPQQLMTLAYYATAKQKFDIVINIDGFNEVASGYTNYAEDKIEVLYPAAQTWKGLGNAIEADHIKSMLSESVEYNYYQLQASNHREAAVNDCITAACYFIRKTFSYYYRYQNKGTKDRLQRNPDIGNLSRFLAKYKESKTNKINDIYTYIAETWRNSSVLMHGIAKSQSDMHYLHVLQPNQWYRKSGKYIPRSKDHIYKKYIEPVNFGYNAFLKQEKNLVVAGVDFFDATKIFSDLSHQNFIDDCCHYTEKGNNILMKAIANHIAKKIK